MSRKQTKQERIEELEKQLEQVNALNKQLADVLKMTEDGQWVVISEKDLNRYRNGIDALLKAGDELAKRTEFFQKRWDADEVCVEVVAWEAAKASDKF
jgi:hypothetical protein